MIVFGVSLFSVMGVSSLVPILPLLVTIFSLEMHEVGLVITAFTLPGIFMGPLAGLAADRFGRKPVLVPALFVYGFFGTACAFAPNLEVLLLMRFLQGCGVSALGVLCVTLISDLFTGKERLEAMGYNSTVINLGATVAPVLGGFLAIISWKLPFLLSTFAMLLAVIVWRYLDTVVVRSTMGLKAYFSSLGHALCDVRMILIFSITLLNFVILYGCVLTYVPVLLQKGFGASPSLTGFFFAASSVASAAIAFNIGRISLRFNLYTLIGISAAAYTVSCLGFMFASGLWQSLASIVFFGMGLGMNGPCVMTLLSNSAKDENRASIMSINSMILYISMTISPLVTGMAYVYNGLPAVYAVGLCAGLSMLLMTFFLRKTDSRVN